MAFSTISWPDTGELTRQIVIKPWSDIPNAMLAIDQTYGTPLTCWAKVQPVTGVLYWAGKQIDNEVSDIFWVRYYDGTRPEQITGQHVIEWNGRRYRVMRTTNAGDAQCFTMIEAKNLGAI